MHTRSEDFPPVSKEDMELVEVALRLGALPVVVKDRNGFVVLFSLGSRTLKLADVWRDRASHSRHELAPSNQLRLRSNMRPYPFDGVPFAYMSLSDDSETAQVFRAWLLDGIERRDR